MKSFPTIPEMKPQATNPINYKQTYLSEKCGQMAQWAEEEEEEEMKRAEPQSPSHLLLYNLLLKHLN